MESRGRGNVCQILTKVTGSSRARVTRLVAWCRTGGRIRHRHGAPAHPLTRRYMEVERQRRATIPIGRFNEPEDIADMAAFLAGPGSRNITGQAINVDGGCVMH